MALEGSCGGGSVRGMPRPAKAWGSLDLMDGAIQHLEGTVPARIELRHGSYTIGRGSSSDIPIKAQMDGKFIISRTHALLQIDEDGCTIKDLNSTNGVFVNNRRISTHKLCHGDVIRFAGMSEVPIGALLTNSNVSVMYMVNLFGNSNTEAQRGASTNRTTPISKTEADAVKEPREELTNAGSSKRSRQILEVAENVGSDMKRPKPEALPAEVESCVGVGPHPDIAVVLQELQVARREQQQDARATRHFLEELRSHLVTRKASVVNNHSDSLSQGRVTSATVSLIPSIAAAGGPFLCHASKRCTIEGSLLKSLMSCALCRELLCIPVVLKCSHGFCCLCLVTSMRKGRHTCPVCCDPPSQSAIYHRSDQLESLVWLLLESSISIDGPNSTQGYEDRLAKARAELMSLGVDPDLSLEYVEVVPDVNRPVKLPLTCQFCGSTEGDHDDPECPHRLQDTVDTDSDDEREEDL